MVCKLRSDKTGEGRERERERGLSLIVPKILIYELYRISSDNRRMLTSYLSFEVRGGRGGKGN